MWKQKRKNAALQTEQPEQTQTVTPPEGGTTAPESGVQPSPADEAQTSPPPEQEPNAAAPLVCVCGQTLQEEQAFCPQCGRSRETIRLESYKTLVSQIQTAKKAGKLRQLIAALSAYGEFSDMQEQKKSAEARLQAMGAKMKKTGKIVGGVSAAVAVLIVGIMVCVIYVAPFLPHYTAAGKAFDTGDYDTAIQEYTAAGTFLNSEERLIAVYLAYGDRLTEEGALLQGAEYYEKAGNRPEAQEKILANADALYAAQRYAEAGSAYSFLNDETGPAKSNYCFGMDAFTRGDYEAALSFFQNAGETGDAPEKVLQCNYIMGKNRLNRQDVDKARTYLSAAQGYEDAADLLAACDLVEVEVLLADGKLNEAKAAYEKLPPELSYNGISVASRLELLNAHPELLNVCGHWEATSDQIEVSDVPYSSYMSGFTWSAETLSPGQSVAVYCSVNDDGTFCLFGEVSYWQFNNYSSLSSQLDRSVITKDFVVDHISSVPSSIWIDDYTELTYDGSAFRLEYQRDEARTSLFYTQYTSIVNYTDRTGTY